MVQIISLGSMFVPFFLGWHIFWGHFWDVVYAGKIFELVFLKNYWSVFHTFCTKKSQILFWIFWENLKEFLEDRFLTSGPSARGPVPYRTVPYARVLGVSSAHFSRVRLASTETSNCDSSVNFYLFSLRLGGFLEFSSIYLTVSIR